MEKNCENPLKATHGLKKISLQPILTYVLENSDIYLQYKLHAFCIDFGQFRGQRDYPGSPALLLVLAALFQLHFFRIVTFFIFGPLVSFKRVL